MYLVFFCDLLSQRWLCKKNCVYHTYFSLALSPILTTDLFKYFFILIFGYFEAIHNIFLYLFVQYYLLLSPNLQCVIPCEMLILFWNMSCQATLYFTTLSQNNIISPLRCHLFKTLFFRCIIVANNICEHKGRTYNWVSVVWRINQI